MNIQQLKDSLKVLVKTKFTPLIVGNHGLGKSEVVAQFSNENNAQFIDLRLGQMEVGDLLGLPQIVDNGGVLSTKHIKPTFMPTSGKGVLFLDEISRAPKDIHQATFQLILDKKIGEHRLPEVVVDTDGNWIDGWFVVAAMNPANDDYVTVDMADKAYVDRFCYIKFTPSVKEWSDYARSKGVCETLLGFFKQESALLTAEMKDFDLSFITPSRRSVMQYDIVLKSNLDEDTKTELSYGILGPEATTMYKAYTQAKVDKTTLKDILTGFDAIAPKINEDVTEGRLDAINSILDELLDSDMHFEGPQVDNLVKFLTIIPRDLLKATMLRVVDKKGPGLNLLKSINDSKNSQELVERLKQ